MEILYGAFLFTGGKTAPWSDNLFEYELYK